MDMLRDLLGVGVAVIITILIVHYCEAKLLERFHCTILIAMSDRGIRKKFTLLFFTGFWPFLMGIP